VQVLAASDPDGNGGSGTQGNRNGNDILKWANPVPQVSSAGARVNGTLIEAANAETEAQYRQRVIDRFRARPQGGAYGDYSAWALEAAGIVAVYPYAGAPGTVDVYIEASESSSGSADGIPLQAQIDAVTALIELDSSGKAMRRPVSANVYVYPIVRMEFDVDILTLSPDTTEGRQAITDALDDYLRGREPYILGLSALPRTDRITSASIAGVVDEAASSVGATIASATLMQGGQPVTAFTLDQGIKAKLRMANFS